MRGIALNQVTDVDGKTFEEQVPVDDITDPAVVTVLDAMNVSVGSEVLELRQQVADLTADVTSTIDALISDHETEIAKLTTERDTVTAERDALQKQLTPGPRLLTPEAFGELFTDEEVAAIGESTHRAAIVARSKLYTRKQPVDLDSPKVLALMAGLVALGLITQERSDAILATGSE